MIRFVSPLLLQVHPSLSAVWRLWGVGDCPALFEQVQMFYDY